MRKFCAKKKYFLFEDIIYNMLLKRAEGKIITTKSVTKIFLHFLDISLAFPLHVLSMGDHSFDIYIFKLK